MYPGTPGPNIFIKMTHWDAKKKNYFFFGENPIDSFLYLETHLFWFIFNESRVMEDEPGGTWIYIYIEDIYDNLRGPLIHIYLM